MVHYYVLVVCYYVVCNYVYLKFVTHLLDVSRISKIVAVASTVLSILYFTTTYVKIVVIGTNCT